MDWLLYLLRLFLERIWDFLRHWYVNGSYIATDLTVRLLEALDRRLALKVNVRYWLQPLFQEKSVIGYGVGFVFRTLRIIFAFVIYSLIIAFAAIIYFLWAAVPFFLIYKTIQAYGIKTNIF